MYEANSQNTLLRIRSELNSCSYNQNMKDYLANMIMQIMNYPRKTTQARHFIRNMGPDRIIMVWYPMSVPFMSKKFNVPLQIFIMKNIPYEPPQIFLEVVQGSAPNAKNTDVDPNTRRIMTNTLRSWSQYSNIENAMNEIFSSFSNTFPIYKTSSSSSNSNAPRQNSAYVPAASGGGGIYNVLNNAVQNTYNQSKPPYQNSAYGPYQPPTTSIYGRSMTLEDNKNKDNQQATFGGGIYDRNVNTYGQGGIYGNQNQNRGGYIPPSTSIYGNNNQNQYGNNQYDKNYGNNYNQYGNNNQFGGGGIYSNNTGYNNPAPPNYMGANSNPDEEFKNILVNEVTNKISNKLIEENKRLNSQKDKLIEYKNKLNEENVNMQKILNDQFSIKSICEEDMSNINKTIKNVKDYNDKNKAVSVNNENCLTYLDIQDSNALKIIADETSMEEMILIVRKGFERKKISLDDAISFMRNSTRDLFKTKYLLKNKVLKKYDGF